MRYGFLDEAGDVGYSAGASGKFIVAVIVVGNRDRLRKAVSRTRKALDRQRLDLSELRASDSSPDVTQKLLTFAAQIGFDAVAVVIDKGKFPRPQDSEDLYRYACVRTVREALERFGPLDLTVDRRYTKMSLRDRLDRMLTSESKNLGITLNIRHEDSKKEHLLQIADALAWTLFQKYERGDETLWKVVQGKVIEVRL